MAKIFYPVHIEFIKNNAKSKSTKELTDLFNKHFEMNITVEQMKACKARNKITSGLSGRFKKGETPWNKGMKGLQIGGEETQFKKGQAPINYRPVGSERISKDGYIEIKVADPNKWKLKHRYIWEQVHGPIPKGYALIFGDSNKLNCDVDNLILVSRSQLAILNKNKLLQQNDIELTKIAITIADLYLKIGERRKKNDK